MNFNDFTPCFLIAMPELEDPNFSKAVIMLTDYNAKGAFGYVINRQTKLNLATSLVLSQGELNPAYQPINLWYGGPVSPELIRITYDASAVSPGAEDIDLGNGIFLASSIDLIINHEKTLAPSQFRVFHGYSGWGAKQLDNEIAISSWITCPLNKSLLFHTPEEKMWESAIMQLGFDPKKLVGPRSVFLN